MTISLARALRHMAWANQKVYDAVELLPEESLKSFVVNEEWMAYEIKECDWSSDVCSSDLNASSVFPWKFKYVFTLAI